MNETQVMERVRAFLNENFLYMRPSFELCDDTPLLESAVVDSMGVVELLHFLEEEFGIEAADDEISEANFGTVRSIARFTLSKNHNVPLA